MHIYYDELRNKYDITKTKQANINKKLIEVEKRLETNGLNFETFEEIKKLYKDLAQTNEELILISRELMEEVEKIR